MSYYGPWGPPPNWGQPQFIYPPQNENSRVVYVPVPNPVKEGDDPVTAAVKQVQMVESLKKIFEEKKKEGGEKKDAKGLSVKEIYMFMCITMIPIGWLTSTIMLFLIKGTMNNIQQILGTFPH